MQVIDHIGIAVIDLEASIEYYRKNFGFEVELREELPSQEVTLAFLKLDNTRLELLAPLEPGSTLSKFLARRGPGLHHICYEVKDIVEALKDFSEKGFKLIDETPRHGANSTLIAFIHPSSTEGVLTELCQYQDRSS